MLIQLCKQAPSRHARDQRHVGTVANGSWVELTYGAHSTHSLGWCPFDRWSTPATRAAPRSEVGRDAKVVPSNERRNGLRHTLTRTRRRLSAWLRGGSHVGGGRRKAALWSDTLWSEREGATHRQGLRTVYDRAEPGPPPEKEAKIFRCRYHPPTHNHTPPCGEARVTKCCCVVS